MSTVSAASADADGGDGMEFALGALAAHTDSGDAVVRWLGFFVGIIVILYTVQSVINTIILPRAVSSWITYSTWLAVRKAFMFIATRVSTYERKDSVLAYMVPVALLAALGTWLVCFLFGFALILWPMIDGNFGAALALSGSSLFTLGVATSAHSGPIIVEYMAAAAGLIVVALQIGYLPAIYSAYNRRETLVSALTSRTSAPAWGPELLARHKLSMAIETLPALYAEWETWAADIMESHTSYPWLTEIRSPTAGNSWVISLLAVLDSAAMYIAISPKQVPPEARQCLRMGYLAFRTLARVQSLEVNDDPRPDDKIHLTYDQFAEGVEHLRRSGFPVERTTEQAWPDFHGWRVNYEAAAYGLAYRILAPPAPWSGKRSYLTAKQAHDVVVKRPVHRTPEDPEGTRVGTRFPMPLDDQDAKVESVGTAMIQVD